MGIADAFSREDRIEIKVESFIRMTQTAAKAEAQRDMLMNAVSCEVPYRYIMEMMTGVKELPEMLAVSVNSDAIDRDVTTQLRKEKEIEDLPE